MSLADVNVVSINRGPNTVNACQISVYSVFASLEVVKADECLVFIACFFSIPMRFLILVLLGLVDKKSLESLASIIK